MEFPYPTAITRESFQLAEFSCDDFLYENHRYTLIDVLIKDLTALLDELKRELLDLVNTDYTDFIRLGKSIDGGGELIVTMLAELRAFEAACQTGEEHLSKAHDDVHEALQAKRQLLVTKNHAKLCLLLLSQIDNFETLVNTQVTAQLAPEHLRNATSVYVSINKLYTMLCHFDIAYIKGLKVKVSNIALEFRDYLREMVVRFREVPQTVFELMKIYRIIGYEADFIQILRQ